MTDSRVFLDSSIWLGYFLGNMPRAREIIQSSSILFSSIISIHEIFKRLKKLERTEREIEQAIQFIEDNSIIINLSKDVAINAVNYCNKYGLHTIDSLIYSSAMGAKAVFVTADADFKKTPKTRLIAVK